MARRLPWVPAFAGTTGLVIGHVSAKDAVDTQRDRQGRHCEGAKPTKQSRRQRRWIASPSARNDGENTPPSLGGEARQGRRRELGRGRAALLGELGRARRRRWRPHDRVFGGELLGGPRLEHRRR